MTQAPEISEGVIRRVPVMEPALNPPEPHANIFAVLHRLLRGRYVLLVSLVLAGSVAGAAAGYLLPKPRYRIDGRVHLKPNVQPILYKTDQSGISSFNNFVSTQTAYLQTDRTRMMALNSDAWKALGRARGLEADEQFRESLKVTPGSPSAEFITVSFTDEDPKAALIAVTELVNAYIELYGGEEQRYSSSNIKVLEDARRTLEAERQTLEAKVRNNAAQFPSFDLELIHERELARSALLDDQLGEIRQLLLRAGIDPDQEQPQDASAATEATDSEAATGPPAPVVLLSPEEIARTDPQMAALIRERSEYESQLRALRARGFGDKHPLVARCIESLGSLSDAIEKYRGEVEARQSTTAAPVSVPSDFRNETPIERRKRYHLIKKQADMQREALAAVSRKIIENRDLTREIQLKQRAIDEISQKLAEIALESKNQIARIEKDLPEIIPPRPNVDPRLKLTVLGFALGGGVPFVSLLLLGLLDRRVRYSDETETRHFSVPLLGMLPQLPANLQDPEQTAAAVHCVHHIRTLLQLSGGLRRVYAVTSPTAGDGKTSLALSLGLSYTAAGCRTLLVDFDLIGRGLSSRLKVQVEKGLGYQIAAGSDQGTLEPVGTQIEGLSLLPAGSSDASVVGKLSAERFDAVIASLRTKYDVVIIDTGPILGSLEASIAANHCDGVILVVGRGQLAPLVKTAIDRLTTLSANLVGLVFNRASDSDFNSSAASKSFRSLSAASVNGSAPPPQHLKALEHLDPLARCLAQDIRS